MRIIVFLGFVMLMGQVAVAQKMTIPELDTLLSMKPGKIDTLLNRKKYHLSKRESDSNSAYYHYSSIEFLQDDIPVSIRSINYMDVMAGPYSSRLLTYRTYSKDEYQQLLAWLLAAGFKTAHQFDFKDELHTLYELGSETIRVKLLIHTLKNGRQLRAYEFELGQ